ncbi:MAG: hypothetical protein ARM1_0078 [Candidatus Micrarchaeota archaeon]|nr:MAG: hypothetical protein ARM1_0078 [Candidatus Micrarchaeota archaeon]
MQLNQLDKSLIVTFIVLLLFSIGIFGGTVFYRSSLYNAYELLNVAFATLFLIIVFNIDRYRVIKLLAYIYTIIFISIQILALEINTFTIDGYKYVIYAILFAYPLFTFYLILLTLDLSILNYIKEKISRRSRIVIVAAIYILFSISLSLIIVYTQSFNVDDEIELSYLAALSIMHGQNPYAANYSTSFYNAIINGSVRGGITYTSSDSFVTIYQYPVLYALSFIPFIVFGLGPDTASIVITAFSAIAILILIADLYIKKKISFLAALIISLDASLLFVIFSGFPDIVIALGLILFFYFKDFRVKGLIAGLMISLQELGMLSFLILDIFYLSRDLKNALRMVAFEILIFILVNGLFIIENPYLFIRRAVFPVADYLMPTMEAPGTALVLSYTTAKFYSYLFIIMLLVSLILSLYIKDSRKALLLSVIPFIFWYHVIIVYIIIPILAYIILYAYDSDFKYSYNRLIGRRAVLIALILSVAFLAYTINQQHYIYIKNFNMQISNSSYILVGSLYIVRYNILSNLDSSANPFLIYGIDTRASYNYSISYDVLANSKKDNTVELYKGVVSPNIINTSLNYIYISVPYLYSIRSTNPRFQCIAAYNEYYTFCPSIKL